MSDAILPDGPEPPPSPVAVQTERYPFWSYHDLLVFVGMFVASLVAGVAVVSGVSKLFRLEVRNDLWRLLPAQFLAYLFLFLGVWLLFRAQYGRPFWRSLGWIDMHVRASAIVAYGVLLAFAVGLLSRLLQTPEVPTPMSKMLSDRTSVIVVAAFGATVGPLCEELIFRGFLQPLFERSLGTWGGILAAAVPFGLLHLQEYGWSWRHGVLITMAGAAFGWMRHRTGSTKASTLMHAAYNGTFFVALLLAPRGLAH